MFAASPCLPRLLHFNLVLRFKSTTPFMVKILMQKISEPHTLERCLMACGTRSICYSKIRGEWDLVDLRLKAVLWLNMPVCMGMGSVLVAWNPL